MLKPINDNSGSQNQFFFISLTTREWIFFKPFQGSFNYPSCLLGQAIDLIR